MQRKYFRRHVLIGTTFAWIALLASGCSSQHIYDFTSPWRMEQSCDTQSPREHSQCMERARSSEAQFQKQRKETAKLTPSEAR